MHYLVLMNAERRVYKKELPLINILLCLFSFLRVFVVLLVLLYAVSVFFNLLSSKSNLHHIHCITLKRVTSGRRIFEASGWATQLRRNIATAAGRWQLCVRFDGSENQTKDLHTDGDVFTSYLSLPSFAFKCGSFRNILILSAA